MGDLGGVEGWGKYSWDAIYERRIFLKCEKNTTQQKHPQPYRAQHSVSDL